jgi:DNA processing protein
VLPDAAYAAALAAVEGVPPARLRRLLEARPAAEAWSTLAGSGRFTAAAARVDVAGGWDACRRAGIEVLVAGAQRYPQALAGDPDAPPVLFALGDPGVVDGRPRVAVVGTSAATRYGLGVAAQLGAELTAAGVTVVSGLAPGIEGAAHEGSTAARRSAPRQSGPPVAVATDGLPAPHAPGRLWARVAEAGVVLSASAPGTAGPRSARHQRLVAALADVVVVVECHTRGRALAVVRAAAGRGVAVGAVPGSVRSPASAGANDLLADGCFVVRDTADVLVALGLARAGDVPVRPGPRAPAGGWARER